MLFPDSSYYSSHFGISKIPGSFIGKDLQKYKILLTNLNTLPQNMSLLMSFLAYFTEYSHFGVIYLVKDKWRLNPVNLGTSQ